MPFGSRLDQPERINVSLTGLPRLTATLAGILAIFMGSLALPSASAAVSPERDQTKKPQLKRRTRLEVLQTLTKSKRWDQAERVAIKLMTKAPDNPQVFYLAGLAQFQQARYGPAVPLFRKAQDLQPDIPGLAKYLAICYFSTRQHPLFESQMERAFMQTPTDPELSFFWGLYQVSVKDNPNSAIKAFDHALQLRPNYVQALYHRGRAFQKLGHKKRAREDFQESIALIEQTFFRGYSYPYQSMARLLMEDSPKGALRFALKSAEIQPRLKNTHILVGEIHWRMGQLRKAVDAFEYATFLDPSDERPHYWLHLLYQRLGKKKEADMALVEFRRLNPARTGNSPPPAPTSTPAP